MNSDKFLFSWRRLILVAIFLLLIFFGLITLLYLKADEITKDPCSICSQRMGEQVVCTTGEFKVISRIYYPNGSIKEG